MSVAVATHNLEPKPRPTPPNSDPVAVLALAFSLAALTVLLTKDSGLAVTIWTAAMAQPWKLNGSRRQ